MGWRCIVAEAKVGREFIMHEFDEAIAIQRALVAAEEALSRVHPLPDAKTALKAAAREDTTFLRNLEKLGKPYGATGKVEDVAASMKDLSEETTSHAAEASSEAYEAHAVVVSMKRKQQDSGAAMLKIARAQRNAELRDAANEFFRAQKAGAQALADSLASFAVVIAGAASSGNGSGNRSSRAGTTGTRSTAPARRTAPARTTASTRTASSSRASSARRSSKG